MRDEDKLRSVGIAFHIVRKAGNVRLVQRGLDFVEHAKRGRLEFEHRKEQRDGGQRAFAAGEQREQLQFLTRRLCDDVDIATQHVVLVREAQLRLTAAEEFDKGRGKVLLDHFKLFEEHALHRLRQIHDQRFQIPLGVVEVFALRIELAVPLKHTLVFLNRTEADVPKPFDLLLNLVHARIARTNGDLALELCRVLIGKVVFVPDVVLHGAELHLQLALGEFLLVDALREVARAGEQFFAPRALLIERGGNGLPLFLNLSLCFLLRCGQRAVAFNLRLHSGKLRVDYCDVPFRFLRLALQRAQAQGQITVLGNKTLLLGIDRVALFAERHAAHLMLGELAREGLALFAQLIEFALRAGNILTRAGVALLNVGLLLVRAGTLALHLSQIVGELEAFVRKRLFALLAVLHVAPDHVELFRLLGRRNFAGMHRVPERIHLNIAAQHVLLRFAQSGLLLLQRGIRLLELFAELLQLAFAAEEIKRLLLQASAAHRAAGADDVALQGCNVERAACTVFERDARVQILHDDRAAQQIVHDVSHVVVAIDQLVCNADATWHVEQRPFFARDARGVE